MVRDDKSKFLLYIEPHPDEKLSEPVDDVVTNVMELAFSKSRAGVANYSQRGEEERFRTGSGYKGVHGNGDGKRSTNNDYLLENGMITNSLCVYYLQWYRNSICENDWLKLQQLAKYYGTDIELPNSFPKSKPIQIDERTSLEKIQDIMVEELTNNINQDILKNITSFNQFKNKK